MSVWFENNKRFIESLSHFGRLKSNSLTQEPIKFDGLLPHTTRSVIIFKISPELRHYP